MSQSLFVFKPEEYKRDLDLLKYYRLMAATFMSIMKGMDFDVAMEIVERNMGEEGGRFAPNDPKIKMLYRKKPNHDRHEGETSLLKLLNMVEATGRIIGPNMVVYENPEKFRAYQGDLIDFNLKRRAKLKKEAQKAKMEKNFLRAAIRATGQVNAKTLNNSLSGANSSPHNPNFAASAHTTLTSTCRTLTSNSNSITERFMAGRRHYYDSNITLENMTAAIALTDPVLIESVMEQYGLEYPTADYLLERVYDWKAMYWKCDGSKMAVIEEYIRKMTPVQLAAVTFTGDMQSWVELNPNFTRGLFDDITLHNIDISNDEMTMEEADELFGMSDDYIMSFVSTLSMGDLKARQLKKLLEEGDTEGYLNVARRLRRVRESITEKYMPWIRAFLTTDLTPQSIHSFPASVREAVIGSDTDSTLFTTQKLLAWYMDGIEFTPRADGVREAITYLNSQIVCHTLAILSRHMGAQDKDLYRLMMKPEFSFPVMGVTNRMKHYYSEVSMCEGNVYEEPELETKGVALKSSKVPKWLIKISDHFMETIVARLKAGELFEEEEIVSVMAYVEHRILDDLRNGKSNAMGLVRIKDPSSYANPERSIVVYHKLWEEVFSKKYGTMGALPAETKKLSVDLTSKTEMSNWVNTLEPSMQEGIKRWMDQTGRNKLTMILIPMEFLKENPLPDELWRATDKAKLINTLMDSFYYIAETTGLYVRNKQKTRFAFQEMDFENAKAWLPFDVESMIPK